LGLGIIIYKPMTYRRTILVTAFCFSLLSVSGQTINELKTALLSTTDPESKVEILNELSWEYRNIEPDSCIFFATESIDLIVKNNLRIHYSEALSFKGLGYRTNGDYNSALECFNQALKIAVSNKDSIQIAYGHNNIGGIYRLKSMYYQALREILEARTIFVKLQDQNGTAYCDINLSVLYRYQNNLDKSNEYLNNVIEYRLIEKDSAGLATAYSLLADNLCDQGDYENAMKYYMAAEEIFHVHGGSFGRCSNLNGRAEVLYALNEIDSAHSLWIEALGLASKINDYDQIIRAKIGLAKVYSKMNQADIARNTIEDAIRISEREGFESRLLEAQLTSAEIAARARRYEQAFQAHLKYSYIKDTIFNREKNWQLQELNAIYETKEKEDLVVEQVSTIQSQNTRNIIMLIILIFSLITLAFMYVYSRNQKKLAKSIDREKETLQELNKLKDQFFSVIAHDLRSPYQTLLGLSELMKEDFDEYKKSELKEFISRIHNSALTGFQLLDELLVWGKTQLGKQETLNEYVNPYKIVESSLSLFKDKIVSKKISIKNEVCTDCGIYSDPNILS